MKVRLTKDWAGYGAGSVVDCTGDDTLAQTVIGAGLGEKVADEEQAKIEKDAVARSARQMASPVDKMERGAATKGKGKGK